MISTRNEQVPAGYKNTEVGVIPEDWTIVSFSELFDFRNGVNANKEAYGQGTPFINVLEVIKNTHLFSSEIPGRVLLPKSLIESYSVNYGDILFNRTSETQEEVGLTSVYLGDELVVFGGFVIRGRNRDSKVDSIYSGYAFRSSNIRAQIVAKGQGAVRANIGQQELSKVLAVLPPLPEQKAIAQVLSDTDTLISALNKLIAKKRNIKTATMQQLLTGQKRLPGFGEGKGYKNTEVGLIPEDWEVKNIGEVGYVSSGGTPSRINPLYWNGSIPWITTTQIDFNFIKNADQFITQSGLNNSAAKLFPAGTLLMAMYGQGKTRGKVAILDIEASTNQACAAISLNESVDHNYVFFFLHSQYDSIRNLSNTGNQENLNGLIIKSIKIPLPPLPEQKAITQTLSDMDAEITALETRLNKTKVIKQGMMQELLTGKVRLK